MWECLTSFPRNVQRYYKYLIMSDGLKSQSELVAESKEIAAKYSPNLDKMVSLMLNSRTTIYVSEKNLKKKGKQHYIDKYKKSGCVI